MLAPVPRRSARAVAGFVALLLAAGAAPALAVLGAGRTLAWSDTAALFAPVRPLIEDALRHGRLPLWNPHEAMGLPLHAQLIHAPLHPVSIAAALAWPGAGVDLLVVLHLALAALGAGVLARALGAPPAAALVAGFGYGLSGYVLGMSSVLTYLGAAATAPWAVAGLRAAGAGGSRGVALGALGLGALHLAGDPQWALAAAALGAALAAEAGGTRGLARAVVAGALGTAIGAVQLAPAWALLAESGRAAGLTAADRAQWALSPWRLVELAAPGFFAQRASENLLAPVFLWLGGETQSRLTRPFVPSVFVGAALLALAAAGVRSGRTGRILAAAAAAFLWLALGVNAGAERLLGGVPIWGSFRYAEKLVGPLTLALALLGALGAARIAGRVPPEGPPDPRPARAAAGAGLASLAVALILLLAPALERLAPDAPAGAAELARRALGIGLLHAAAGLLALGALLAWGRARPGRLAAALAALVLASGLAAAPCALHAGVRGAIDPAPLSALRAHEPVTRVATLFAEPPYRNPAGLGPADLDVAVRSRLGAPPFTVPSRIDNVDAYTGLTPRRVIRFAERFGPDVWIALRRFGLTHVVAKAGLAEPEAGVVAAATAGGRPALAVGPWGVEAWAVPHRPWARFAPRVAPAASGDAALEALFAYDLAGVDVAIVEGPAVPTAPGRLLRAERGTERVVLEAEADGPAFLVVADAWWEGWRATVDGEPAPILRTDYLARGVPFPPGRHVVEMVYAPAEVRVGGLVTLGALAAAVALLAAGSGRRRLARG